VEWLGIEIHPDTPPGGRSVTDLFRQDDVDRMMKHLRAMGAPLGIIFSDITRISNSRLALQAGEFAEEHGRFDELHEALFQAYFSQGLDIGDQEVIMQLGRDAGLDVELLGKALQEGTYLPKLKQAQEEASRLGVTGVPTFFLGDGKALVGAQPLEVFQKILRAR